jgi:hypothetical protein
MKETCYFVHEWCNGKQLLQNLLTLLNTVGTCDNEGVERERANGREPWGARPSPSYVQYKAHKHRLDVNPDSVGGGLNIMQLGEAPWVDITDSVPPFQRRMN